MANETRRWVKGTQRPESYETAIPVRPRIERHASESHAPAEGKPAEFVKTVLSDEAEGVKVLEDRGSGVILLKFKEAPHPDIQQMMEDKGFTWAAVKAAWARPISHEGRTAAREVFEAVRTNEPEPVPAR